MSKPTIISRKQSTIIGNIDQTKAEEEKREKGRKEAFKRGDDDPASRSRVNSGAMHPENHDLLLCTFSDYF